MYQKCITNEQLKQKAIWVESRLRAAILKQSKDKKFILLFFPFLKNLKKKKISKIRKRQFFGVRFRFITSFSCPSVSVVSELWLRYRQTDLDR